MQSSSVISNKSLASFESFAVAVLPTKGILKAGSNKFRGALLEPVEIGGALVSRATLHNIEYIRALNLEIGCTVEVIRSGEIIPRIVRRVYDEKNNS